MHRYDPARQRLAIGLAFLAGTVDATGFVVTGGYFTSFMSGNTTRLGVELSQEPTLVLVPLALIVGFLARVTGGALMRRRVPQGAHKRVLLALVAGMLGLGAALLFAGVSGGFLALAAGAMGVANNVSSRDGEVTVGVTYMTGALVRLGQGLAARMAGQTMPGARGYGLLWGALAGGAVAGGTLGLYDARWAAVAGVALACGLCLWALKIEGSKLQS